MENKISKKLIVGIILLPIVFAWFTLKKGYSKKAKVFSFGWLFLSILLTITSSPDNIQNNIVALPNGNSATEMTLATPIEPQTQREKEIAALAEEQHILYQTIYDASQITPTTAYVIEPTKYMHAEFELDSIYIDAHLLQIKNMLPILLTKYPGVDKFFFGFKLKEGDMFFLKANFERSMIKDIDWDYYKAEDVPQFAASYWSHP